MSNMLIARIAGMFTGQGETALPRRAFIGAAVAGAALAAIPAIIAKPALADSSDRDHIGDALEDLRKARREIAGIDHDHNARDRAIQQIDQAIAATQQIQRR